MTLSKTLSGATGTVRIEPEALTGSLSFMQTDSNGNKTQWWLMSGGSETNYVAAQADIPIRVYNPTKDSNVDALNNELNSFQSDEIGLLMLRGLTPANKEFQPLTLNGQHLRVDVDYVVEKQRIIASGEAVWLFTGQDFNFENASSVVSNVIILMKNKPFRYNVH